MGDREKLDALLQGPFDIGGGQSFAPGEPLRVAIADAILASDWLRDTLAAERERCAKAEYTTAGADAAEARVVAWLRERAASEWLTGVAQVALFDAAADLAARAHWQEGA